MSEEQMHPNYEEPGEPGRETPPAGPPPESAPPPSPDDPFDLFDDAPPPRGPANAYPSTQNEYRWSFEDYESASKKVRPPKRNGVLGVIGILLTCILAIGIICLSGYGVYSLIEAGRPAPPSNAVTSASSSLPPAPNRELAIKEHPVNSASAAANGALTTVEIAKRVRASVVGITQYTALDAFSPANQGSGIIINSDGYIVTNAHVVEGAAGINVELDSGESYVARLVGIDLKTDLAIIKIEAANLVAAEFGNSDTIQVGERVIAIGNPGGSVLAGSVSQGIISGINRSLNDGSYGSTYIQTDAAINPGNSGGALVNEYGQVIGINSNKIASVAYEGIGFAIPISEAKPILDQLLQYGYVKGRAKLGITGQVINEAISQIQGIPVGVYIWSVDPLSALAGQNVSQGDIITAIDKIVITDFDDISAILKTKSPGDEVTLTLYRSARGIPTSGRVFEVKTILMEDTESSPIQQRQEDLPQNP